MLTINSVPIEDTFAEAFPMRAARIVITAVNERWAREAALKLTGFATSVIACKCEAAIEQNVLCNGCLAGSGSGHRVRSGAEIIACQLRVQSVLTPLDKWQRS